MAMYDEVAVCYVCDTDEAHGFILRCMTLYEFEIC